MLLDDWCPVFQDSIVVSLSQHVGHHLPSDMVPYRRGMETSTKVLFYFYGFLQIEGYNKKLEKQ
jgi:hypothetical protein